jgi:hypothetical protein
MFVWHEKEYNQIPTSLRSSRGRLHVVAGEAWQPGVDIMIDNRLPAKDGKTSITVAK